MTMPEKISREDALQLENFALRMEALQSQQAATEAQREGFMRTMRDRYHLGEQDKIDLRSLEIKRAPKPEPVKDEPKPAEPPA